MFVRLDALPLVDDTQNMTNPNATQSVSRLGIDLGSANLHVHARAANGREQGWVRPVRGRPLEVLSSLVEEEVSPFLGRGLAELAVTGQGRDLLRGVVPFDPINEVVAVASGARALYPDARTVMELGGQLSKWILLDTDGSILDFATNSLCAAGSGSFLEQQASRLRITVEDFGQIASTAKSGATVAGRCSVFAKSDMIHLQQKGTPTPQIAYGVCQALIRTYTATVLEGRELEGPVVLAGGGAANPGLVRALKESCGPGVKLRTPPSPLCVGASGASLLTTGDSVVKLERLANLDTGRLRTARLDNASTLPPLSERPPRREVADALPADGPVEAFMGVDVGSVSTNLVLMSPARAFLLGIYLRTRGAPVEALAEGLRIVRDRLGDRLVVLGTGTTGSGRHLAANILGADVVRNEITAQMISTHHYVPDADTVFEIGGQDSKYIGLRRGRLSNFEMNKICAAGTGSFLEEQAEKLGKKFMDELLI